MKVWQRRIQLMLFIAIFFHTLEMVAEYNTPYNPYERRAQSYKDMKFLKKGVSWEDLIKARIAKQRRLHDKPR